jgi:hypothetical protein
MTPPLCGSPTRSPRGASAVSAPLRVTRSASPVSETTMRSEMHGPTSKRWRCDRRCSQHRCHNQLTNHEEAPSVHAAIPHRGATNRGEVCDIWMPSIDL